MQHYLQVIEHEVNRAKALHPNKGIDLNLQIVILTEEVGEAAKAAIDYQFKGKPIQDLRDELIQTAAMAIRTLELIEGYPDTKVTDFKVGDRVTSKAYPHIQGKILHLNFETALVYDYSENYVLDLTDLILI
jgi:hypothetical protein